MEDGYFVFVFNLVKCKTIFKPFNQILKRNNYLSLYKFSYLAYFNKLQVSIKTQIRWYST